MAKRSRWKGPLISYPIYTLLKKNFFKTRNRAELVIPALLGKIVKIYTGRVYIKLKITQEMLGFKLGSFSVTRVTRKINK